MAARGRQQPYLNLHPPEYVEAHVSERTYRPATRYNSGGTILMLTLKPIVLHTPYQTGHGSNRETTERKPISYSQ